MKKILLFTVLIVSTLLLAVLELSSHPVFAAEIELQAQATSTVTSVTPPEPVVVSTPDSDGAIVHVVEYGQTLIAIAEAYGVPLDQLQSLNRITGSEIFVGDTLIIRLAPTVTSTVPVTPSPTVTRTPRPTRTPIPTRVPPTATQAVTETSLPPAEESKQDSDSSQSIFGDPLLIGIAALAGIGLAFMVAGTVMRRRQ